MSQNYLGTIDTDSGVVKVLRKARGRDLYKGLNLHGQAGVTSYLVSALTQVDDKPIRGDEVEELEMGILQAVQNAISDNVVVEEVQVGKYPKQYKLTYPDDEGKADKTIEISESVKGKHTTTALKQCGGKRELIGFYWLPALVKVDGKSLRFDDFLDLPSAEVEAIVTLLKPKKYQFSPRTK